eukprot:1961468-Pleurochrysis_carterae.AAC.1
MAAATPAQPSTSATSDATRPAAAAQQPRCTLRDLPAGAGAHGRGEGRGRRSDETRRGRRGAAPDVVGEAHRLVTHPDFGSGRGVVGGLLQREVHRRAPRRRCAPRREGALPASVVVAREHLLALTRRARVVSIVGEERLTAAVQDEVDQLVTGILTADVQLDPTRAGTYRSTGEGRGRWGRTKTLAAAADIREALGHLAGMLGVLYVLADAGAPCTSPYFFMVELARPSRVVHARSRAASRSRWASSSSRTASSISCAWQPWRGARRRACPHWTSAPSSGL